MATMWIGMSRSVWPTACPRRRVRAETAASAMPRRIGPRIFKNVQAAATAMAPAPMNRTSVEKILATATA
ncbi:Uncharacterised protein [Mycobacterium tuberculosis]|nr:Uncharacterised protein [Mycobacterium tuberculosis]